MPWSRSPAECSVPISACGCKPAASAPADVTVICGRIELDPADPKCHTALNPTLIVEVLSPSTENYDRGDKLGNYKLIPSLAEVVMVPHDRHEVEVVRRESDGSWSRHIARAEGTVELVSLGCALSVPEIYRDPLARPVE
jgi:Uma2 family endonuclease